MPPCVVARRGLWFGTPCFRMPSDFGASQELTIDELWDETRNTLGGTRACTIRSPKRHATSSSFCNWQTPATVNAAV